MADLRSRLPAWAPAAAVLLIAAAGIVRVLTQHWREGGVLLGGALLVAAILRVLLTPEQAGLLVVRSRFLDAVCYTGLGAAMVFLAATITRDGLILT